MNKNIITVIYKDDSFDSSLIKTFESLTKAIAFVLKNEIDKYLFLKNGEILAGSSSFHELKAFKIEKGIILQLQVGYCYIYTNTGNLYKLEDGSDIGEQIFFSEKAIYDFLKEEYKDAVSNYCIVSHYTVYTDSYSYECGHYDADEDEECGYYEIYHNNKSGNESKCLQELLQEDGIDIVSDDYFNLAEAIRLFAEQKTETDTIITKIHKRHGLCHGCLNARNTRIKTWYHGLQAFRKTDDGLNGSIQRVIDIMSNKWDICVSSDPIGPIGLMYKGSVDRYYDHDTWSYLDECGNRIPGHENKNSDHDEGILNSTRKAVGIWVKSWYLESLNSADLQELSLFSNELNLKIVTLPARK